MRLNKLLAAESATFLNETFQALELDKSVIENKQFENCNFKKCQFSEASFNNCEFFNCEWIASNFSMTLFKNTRFDEVVFEACKLVGVDWTKLKWPQIKLTCPMKFYQCDLSFANFFELNLIDIVIEQCKVHEADFRGASLNGSSLCYNDFYKSLFQHCNLTKCNFIGSSNYQINPQENILSKAKFSFPEVIGLLKDLDIEIQDLS